MISDDKRAHIVRLYTVEKWRINTIARQLGVHHSAVERVVREHQAPPVLVAQRPSQLDPFVPFMQETLSRYPRLTAARLWHMVRERGYRGRSPSHFRAMVARLRPRPAPEAFLRLATVPGEQAQVDWAYFGKPTDLLGARSLWAFVMVLSSSRMLFVRFFWGQTQSLFLSGHQAAFEFFGGVPRVLLYDNLKSAVLERVGDAVRFHPRLWDFATAYGFEPRPVAVARGNEKGRVERAIRYLRSAFYAARPYEGIERLNAQVRAFCAKEAAQRRCPQDPSQTVQQAFDQERLVLRPLPPVPYPTAERIEVTVGKTPYVRFDKNDYSVPHTLVRKTVVLEATEERVRILCGDQEQAHHQRSWEQGAVIEDRTHIQALLAQKKQARQMRTTSRLLKAAPSAGPLLERIGERAAPLGPAVLRLERLLDLYGPDELEAALQLTAQLPGPDIHAIQLLLDQRRQQRHMGPPVSTSLPQDSPLRTLSVVPHALSTYDSLPKEDDDGSR